MSLIRRFLVTSVLLAAVVLSAASSGHRSSTRLPVSGWQARSMFPQIVAASEQLGFNAYEHDDAVHVDAGDDSWVYFSLFQSKFRKITEVPEALRGEDRRAEEQRVADVAEDIWQLALELRAEVTYGPRERPRRRSRDRDEDRSARGAF